MRTALVTCFVLASLAGGTLLNGSVAAQDVQSREHGAGTGVVPMALGFDGDYLIGYVNSLPGVAATVVSLTNLTTGDCDVSVDWIPAFALTPACTTTTTIPSGWTMDHCTLDLDFNIVICNAVCVPDLVMEGKAIVTIESGCRKKFGVDARLYHTTTAGTAIEGVSALRVVLIRTGRGQKGD